MFTAPLNEKAQRQESTRTATATPGQQGVPPHVYSTYVTFRFLPCVNPNTSSRGRVISHDGTGRALD